jgi:hypothetical protein
VKDYYAYSKSILFLSEQSALSLPDIIAPLPFIPLISLLIHDLSVPMFLSLLKVALIHGPIGLCLLALASDLPVLELALIPGPIPHEQHTLPLLDSPLIVPLVLEVRVVVSVHALPLTQLCHRVQVTHVTLYYKTVNHK